MTVKSEKKSGKMCAGQVLFCIMGTVCLVLTFIYSDEAIDAMGKGMRLCVNTVIPSLFPFLVVSEIFVASGGATLVGKLLSPVLGRIFGISGEGCVAYILGVLCGFPIGSRSAVSLYERGIIGKGELLHICSFCNGPSSAFLISAVGSTLFASKRIGIILYVSHIITSALVGFVSKFYFSAHRGEGNIGQFSRTEREKPCGIAESVVSAVSNSAMSMLYVCAFVLFFSSMTPFLLSSCSFFALPPLFKSLLFGFFEMTGGAFEAASLPMPMSFFAVAAITFWSGLSVFFQFVGIIGTHKISFVPYLVCKAAGAVACSVVFVFLLSVM